MPITVVHNINGYTIADRSLQRFGALAFSDGTIAGVGALENSMKQEYPDARFIDGRGATLLPGLIDAHGHLLELGYACTEVDLRKTTSLEEALDLVSDYSRRNPDTPWIRGRGWNQVKWGEKSFPSSGDLDKVVPDRPVWLERVDSHAGWANSKAVHMAGIDKGTTVSGSGRIQHNRSGNPNGIFIDSAMELIRRILPGRTQTEREKALENAQTLNASFGLTAVHDAASTPDMIDLYLKMSSSKRLKTRINAMLLYDETAIDHYSNKEIIDNELVRVQSVKLFADGALGSRGAALLEPYNDDRDNYGILFYDLGTLSDKIRNAANCGFQVNIHAIGDRANHQVLDAFEVLYNETGPFKLRHRIEHAQLVSDGDVPRFAELGLIASVQPVHMASDWRMAEKRLGRDRLHEAYKWHSFLETGVLVAGGSDFPVESSNPFMGLYTALSRKDLYGEPVAGWSDRECMTRLEALRAFTIDAAFAGGQERIIGSLEPGKLADFILVDTDYFMAHLEDIPKTKVLQTWMDGQCVYNSQP